MALNYNPNYSVRRLTEGEKVESFDCGDADLNDFILNTAPLYRDELLAVTYVMEDEKGKVLAYFSLSNDKVSMSEFESKTEFNRFRKHLFVNSKRLKSYPAVKIGRLAVDLTARGLHIGTQLLHFIKLKSITDTDTGCRFITVDAYIDRIPFYIRNGFKEMTDADKDDEHTRVLIYDLKKMLEL